MQIDQKQSDQIQTWITKQTVLGLWPGHVDASWGREAWHSFICSMGFCFFGLCPYLVRQLAILAVLSTSLYQGHLEMLHMLLFLFLLFLLFLLLPFPLLLLLLLPCLTWIEVWCPFPGPEEAGLAVVTPDLKASFVIFISIKLLQQFFGPQ